MLNEIAELGFIHKQNYGTTNQQIGYVKAMVSRYMAKRFLETEGKAKKK